MGVYALDSGEKSTPIRCPLYKQVEISPLCLISLDQASLEKCYSSVRMRRLPPQNEVSSKVLHCSWALFDESDYEPPDLYTAASARKSGMQHILQEH